MIHKLVIIPILLALSSCHLFPSKYEFNSQLITQLNGKQVCANANSDLYTESEGDEVISINFANSLNFFDLRPEGENYSNAAVKWSKLSYDGKDTYAILSKPDKLKVGDIDSLTETQVCVTFYKGLFEDNELNLQKYRALAGQQCCGVLSKKEIEREK